MTDWSTLPFHVNNLKEMGLVNI